MLLLGHRHVDAPRRGGARVGARACSARVELGGHADDGPPRHAEKLAPAIEYCCAQLGHELDQRLGDRGRHRAGDVHGPARRRDHGQGARAVVAHPGDPGPEPRPARVSAAPRARRLIVPAIDARRNELYYALYRTVPGGVQRVSEYELGSAATISWPSSKRAARTRCSAATARCGSRPSSVDVEHVRARRARARGAEPGRAGRARGRRATSARSSARRRRAADVPPQERRRDRVGPEGPLSGDRAADRRPARGARGADAPAAPARRVAHRGAGVPDAVDARAVRERARVAVDARRTSSRRSGARSSATPG